MLNIAAVFVGGGLGAVLRFLIAVAAKQTLGLPLVGTFCANVLGCLIMGLMFALFLMKADALPTAVKLFITVGFLGGLTTFSTFSVETFDLFKDGKIGLGLGYLSASCAFGLLSVYLGYWTALKLFR